jgi:hypothetical protein
MNRYLYYWTWILVIILLLYMWFEHPGHTYGGFVPSFTERGMTILTLSNLTLRSEIICQMFRSWWDFGEVRASCAKSVHSCSLLLKYLKSSLFLVLNENFQHGDLEAPGCLSYPIVRPSAWFRDHLRKIMSNTVFLKLWGVYHTQSCNPPHGLEII